MRTVKVDAATPGNITLGRRGENGVTEVVFDLSSLIEAYGDGTASLLAKRSQDSAAYPVSVVRDGNTVTWPVSDADTSYTGRGSCELYWYVGEALAKTVVWTTVVSNDIGDASTTPPDPWQSWVDSVLDAAQDAEDAAERAVTAAASIKSYSYADTGDGNITITEAT